MTKVVRTIYQTSRIRARMGQEEAAYNLATSVRQLARYESSGAEDSTDPPDTIVAKMMEVYSDSYLGYLHLMKSPVAQALLPKNLSPTTPLAAVTKLSLACNQFMGKVLEAQAAALDGHINANERPVWDKCISDASNILAAALEVMFVETSETGGKES